MKKTRILVIVLSAALVTMACACPLSGLLEQYTNPETLIEMIPEDLTDQIPEDFGETLEEIATAMPDVVEEGMEMIPESVDETDLDSLFDQGVPENIPMVEDYDDLLSFGGVINYGTTTSMEAMKEFYEQKMPEFGWTVDTSVGNTDLGPYAAALNYVNETEQCTITIVESEGQTLVTIIVTGK